MTSAMVVRDYGPSVLEALQVEHLAYLDGRAFYEHEKRARSSPPTSRADCDD